MANLIYLLIGLSETDFYELLESLPSLEHALKSKKKSMLALQMFLMRIRTGDFLYRNRNVFNVFRHTQKKYRDTVRNSFESDFLPLHLGIQNFTRVFLIKNNSKMAEKLYLGDLNNKVILVADATYIYFNKSQNYSLQRDTYSDQKKRNFIKPMVLVTTNGLIVDIYLDHIRLRKMTQLF